ncbi:G-type lectin S-receptor-like serine/threonine-protein kinase RKS1 isoform X1 [Ricinus communis]|uniref:G-type lectin S-receptor-like serine/threonine-protein kinase RKS1 isoform X1 n=3 Tax=Ricinus communis TaxID=3988 RepID=UPI00201A9A64|nr:G-type lectin S-receptor-like serine/threonine-protein kinase RKS1 isoform X1 [Ricinus communis]
MEARLHFAVLLSLQLITVCSCKDAITINQTLREGDLLVSKENNFALGFFSPNKSNNRTYLGIWFYKVPVQTVVWVANRNSAISKFSSGLLSINQRGNLVLLTDNNTDPVWSTNVSVTAADTLAAQLLDTGNLVLVLGRRILWQSFDHPTNTFIQGMKLGVNRISGINWFLRSWKSADDPRNGDYSFKLNPSGSPQLYIYNGTEHSYWRTSPWPWKTYPSYLQNSFVRNEDEINFTVYVHDASIITRLVLDHSGSLKWLTWHQEQNQWKELWSAPKDRCDLYGLCGANSKCDYNIVNQFECNCLPGYEPKSPKDWNLWDGSGGCVRKRLNSSSVCGHGEGFIKVESVKFPDTSAAVWVDMSTSLMDCERICKSNCSCSAYASIDRSENGSGCLIWYGDLIDTRNFLGGIGEHLYVRVDALELAGSLRRSSSLLDKKGMLSILILSAVSAWFVLVIILIYFWLRMRRKKGTRKVKNKKNKRLFDSLSGSKYQLEGGSGSHPDLVIFNLNTIRAATDNFSPSNKIGQGGFGTVYKGQLANGQEVAVKRMSKNSRQGIEEFKNEAMLIAKLQHRNLVKLIGCCIQRKEQILIYEYMRNGSLDSFLFNQTRKSQLDWRKRFDIIIGIARGILYLHQDSRLKIIHRDLKSSNILLDVVLNPKISDFGMATVFQNDEVQGKTNRIVGTYGYMSPEYAIFGKFSVKSDVFSFGVILLEIISGRKNNDFSQEDSSLSLIGHIWELWKEGKALQMVDALLIESLDPQEAMRCIQVGLLCVQEDAMDRPTMLEVVLMLKSDTSLPSPKQSAFVFRATSRDTSTPGREVSYSINDITVTELQTR